MHACPRRRIEHAGVQGHFELSCGTFGFGPGLRLLFRRIGHFGAAACGLCGRKIADGPSELAFAFRNVALQALELLRIGAEEKCFQIVGEEAGPELASQSQCIPMLNDGVDEREFDCTVWFVLGDQGGAEGLGGPG